MAIKGEQASIVALQAMTFLASDDVLLGEFLTQSGASSDDLGTMLQERWFLASLLGFLLESDVRVIDFCNVYTLKPQDLHRHYYALAGEYVGS